MSDKDGYPTLEELQKIGDWPSGDVHGLFDYIGSIWWQPEWGWNEYDGKEDDEPIRVIYASTGGWSGNEDIMQHFRANFLAYHQAFVSYRRGGHYVFHLPARKS